MHNKKRSWWPTSTERHEENTLTLLSITFLIVNRTHNRIQFIDKKPIVKSNYKESIIL